MCVRSDPKNSAEPCHRAYCIISRLSGSRPARLLRLRFLSGPIENMRENFTDLQKAEIFVRDHALCGFSGKSLWILDHGVSPTFDVDWVDHIKPASRGGSNDIGNGICASYRFNSKKRANSNDNQYFFLAGRATGYFYYFYEVIPDHVFEHIERFSKAHISDWYFNRALSRFMHGLDSMYQASLGVHYSRGSQYWARSSANIIKKWRSLASDVPGMKERDCCQESLPQIKEQCFPLKNANPTLKYSI